MNREHRYPAEMSADKCSTVRPAQPPRPTKGKYLKDPPANVRRRRRRRKLNPRFVILMAVLLLMLIGIAIGIKSCTRPSIKGRWNLDGTTVYEFYKDGKGALVLTTMKFDFTYEIEDDKLTIDFVDEDALDAVYSFEIKDKILYLSGGPGDSTNVYALHLEK